LQAELPGTVLGVAKITVTKAISIEGANLNSSASSYFIGPGDGLRTNLSFDVSLGQPARGSRGWAEVAGFIECSSAENLRTIELFSGKLQTGARGPQHGAEIEFLGSAGKADEKIVFRADIPPERLLWLKAYAEGGQAVELSRANMMTVGNRRTYTFVATRTIPRSGKIVVGLLEGEKTVRLPFALTNVSLLGQPLAAR
jgi:hypothetical protein